MPETFTHPDFRPTHATRRLEVQAKKLEKLADQLELNHNNPIEYIRTLYRDSYTRELIPVIELTEDSKIQVTSIKDILFGDHLQRLPVPLGKEFDMSSLDRKKLNLMMNGLLATSLIRRRTGGYVCSFTDDFHSLQEEIYLARILHIDESSKTTRILFDHWPGEYLHSKYVERMPDLDEKNNPLQEVEKAPQYLGIDNPLTIGPECVVPTICLLDGKPHEDIVLWAKNLIRRNTPFR